MGAVTQDEISALVFYFLVGKDSKHKINQYTE